MKNELIERKSAQALGVTAICVRMLYILLIDSPDLLSSAWLSVLIALPVALIPLIAALFMRRASPGVPAHRLIAREIGAVPSKIWMIAIAAALVYDSAAGIHTLMQSARFYALNTTPHIFITTGITVAAAIVVSTGLNALGSLVLIMRRWILILILIIVAFQLRYLNYNWLFPLLGPGPAMLAKGAMPLAGESTIMVALWLVMAPDDDPRGTALPKSLVIACVYAMGLMILESMLVPTMLNIPLSRNFLSTLVFVNGRAARYLQMPIILSWTPALLIAIAFEMSVACTLVSLCFPRIPKWGIRLSIPAMALLIELLASPGRAEFSRVSFWYCPLLGVPMIIAALLSLRRTRRRAHGQA